MIKNIMKDPMFLQTPSKEVIKDDLKIVQDLYDTIKANKEKCVGMAANMIGVHKRIIIFWNEQKKDYQIMINPNIIRTSGQPYQVMEGCLSLNGERQTKRYTKIKVQYQDEQMKIKIATYEGFCAQIIQHEIDHCNGILI